MKPENWNIPEIIDAVIQDDPDADAIADSLKKSLADVQAGKYTAAQLNPIMQKPKHQP